MQAIESGYTTEYWHKLKDGRFQCDVCPRACKLKPGQRGLCFVRGADEQGIVLLSYGRSSGFCIDPIEKKPLNHFLPGTPILSFGTAGCNLACKFCQNWDISKSREMDTLAADASPERIATAAKKAGCRSVAYTYNDPVIFLEYAVDVAQACREQGIYSVAVSAGYIEAKPARVLFPAMDAANIDLKAFSEKFYWTLTGGHLRHVLETLEYLASTSVWFEITTLLIPGQNDSDQEVRSMCQWIVKNLGPDRPLHFSAFHPDYKMMDTPVTPKQSLLRAYQIARECGVHHVYTGNVHDKSTQSTYCHSCGTQLIGRDWYELSEWALDAHGNCTKCGTKCAGVFAGYPGDWGSKRRVIDISQNYE